MELDHYSQSLLCPFANSLVCGAIANKANFSSMGAISDWVNIGDQNRLRVWVLAIATATIGVGILEVQRQHRHVADPVLKIDI